jgi:hypothetical protein
MDGERDMMVRDIARRIVKDLTGIDLEIEPKPELELDEKIEVAQSCVALKLTLQEVGAKLVDPKAAAEVEEYIAKAIGYAESAVEALGNTACADECDEMQPMLDEANAAADSGNWVLAKGRLWTLAGELRDVIRGNDEATEAAAVPRRW